MNLKFWKRKKKDGDGEPEIAEERRNPIEPVAALPLTEKRCINCGCGDH